MKEWIASMEKLQNYITGQWITGDGDGQMLYNAVTGEPIAAATTKGLDFKSIVEYGRNTGNPALRKMSFRERGNMLKAFTCVIIWMNFIVSVIKPVPQKQTVGWISKVVSVIYLPMLRFAENFRMTPFVLMGNHIISASITPLWACIFWCQKKG